ncbi:MAG: hypothetical protein WC595_03415 [Candidatus Nanoarchaeia archaeon]
MNNIHINNEPLLQEKIKQIKEQGKEKLHVVSDFDRTLTKSEINGRKIPSAISLIREGGYLTPDYAPAAYALFDKYHPIEIDPTVPLEEKTQKMQEWWEAHEQLLVKSGMHKKVIEDVFKKYPKVFREGTLEFLDLLSTNNIPLLIFSSGVGNLIEGWLHNEGKLTPNVHILSNTFNFNEQGYATGYKDKVIHVFNKSETAIQDKNYLNLIKARSNVLLLGDSLGDLGMTAGLHHNTIIKVGFLNEGIEKNLELYKENFDVVITEDGSMDYVNQLLNNLL